MTAPPSNFNVPQIFGTFADLTDAQRQDVASYLRAAWRAQFGRNVGSLAVDLSALEALYAPALQAKRLRAMAGSLAAIPRRRPHIDPALFVSVDVDHGFVTPEGRVLLEIVGVEAGDTNLQDFLGQLVDFYAAPRREWMAQVFVGGDLRPATIGFVVFLLMNGSTSASQGLSVPATPIDDQRLADAIMPVVNAFVTGIGAQPLTGRERNQIRGNWAVTESRRQLPMIVRQDGVRRVEKIYIGDGKESDAISAVAIALARRRGLGADDLRRALDLASGAYSNHRPLLKAWGLSWETAQHTAAACDELVDSFERHVGSLAP